MHAEKLEPLKFYGVFNIGNGYQYRISKENRSYPFSKYNDDTNKTLLAALKGRNKVLKNKLPKSMAVNLFGRENFSVSEKQHYYQVSVRVLITRKVYYITLPKSKFTRAQAEKELFRAYCDWFKLHNAIAEKYNEKLTKAFQREMTLEEAELKPHVKVTKFQPELWQQIALQTFPNLENEHYVSDAIHNKLLSLKDNKQSKAISLKKKKAHILSFKNLPFYSVILDSEQCSDAVNYAFVKIVNGDNVDSGSFIISTAKEPEPIKVCDLFNKIDVRIVPCSNGGNSLSLRFFDGITINDSQDINLMDIDSINITIESIAAFMYTANKGDNYKHDSFLSGYNLETMQSCRDAAVFILLTGILREVGSVNFTDEFREVFLNDIVSENQRISSKSSDILTLPIYTHESQDYTDLKKSIVAICNHQCSITNNGSVEKGLKNTSKEEAKDTVRFKFKVKVRNLPNSTKEEQEYLEKANCTEKIAHVSEVKILRESYLESLESADINKLKVSIDININPESPEFLCNKLAYNKELDLPGFELGEAKSLLNYGALEVQAHKFSLAEDVLKHHQLNKTHKRASGKSFNRYNYESCAFFFRALTRRIDACYTSEFLSKALNKMIVEGKVTATKNLFKLSGKDDIVYKRDLLGSKLITLNAIKSLSSEDPNSYLELVAIYKNHHEANTLESRFNELNSLVFSERKVSYPAASTKFIVDKFPDQLSIPLCSCCGEEPNVSLTTINGMHYLSVYCSNDCFPAYADNDLLRKNLFKPMKNWLNNNIESVYLDEVSEFGISELYARSGKIAVKEMLDDTYSLLSDIKSLIGVKDYLNSDETSKYNHFLRTPFIESNIDYSLSLCKFYLDVVSW